MNWGEFFAMGGYAGYVWGAYGITFVVLALNILFARWRSRNVARALTDFYRARKRSE